jgi:hypothetical protein
MENFGRLKTNACKKMPHVTGAWVYRYQLVQEIHLHNSIFRSRIVTTKFLPRFSSASSNLK